MNTNGNGVEVVSASTELELVVLAWVRDWLGCRTFSELFTTASTATMHARCGKGFVDRVAHARGSGDLTVHLRAGPFFRREGAIAIGLGQANVRKVPVDCEFRMRTDELARILEHDAAAGKRPCCIVPTVGTTSTTSIDAINPAVEMAERYGAWVHVDGAYGGCAAIYLELYSGRRGCSSSLVVNPHKWMFTPIDLSILYTSRPEILRRAFSLVPEYLRTGG